MNEFYNIATEEMLVARFEGMTRQGRAAVRKRYEAYPVVLAKLDMALSKFKRVAKRNVRSDEIYDEGKYKASVGGTLTKEYILWKSMLSRCYGANNPNSSYEDKQCTVTQEWKSFQAFADWCNSQAGFGIAGWDLDKDLVGNGKFYSPENCVFLPRRLNALLTVKGRSNGVPVGVTKRGNSYNARMNTCDGGRKVNLGSFTTPGDAFAAYKAAKEEFVRGLAEQYKDALDRRAYVALKQYTVHRTD